MERIINLVNNLELKGVSARLADGDIILEIEGQFEERFDSLEEMSECLNARSHGDENPYLDEVDQAICFAAREAGLLDQELEAKEWV